MHRIRAPFNVTTAGQSAAIAALGAKAKVTRYDHGWHMLLRDLEGESVARDVADWVLGRKP